MNLRRAAPLALITALASAPLVGGCATGPYDNYGSGYGYGGSAPAYGYYDAPFYGPAYSNRDNRDYREYRNRDYRWQQDRDNRVRDGRDWRIAPSDRVVRPEEWRDSNGELRDREGRTAADRDRAANSASPG